MITTEEIGKIFKVLLEVDGGCSVCAKRAINHFCELFPQHKYEMIVLALIEPTKWEPEDFAS